MQETSNFENSKASEKRSRLAENLVRVHIQKSNGQYRITLPRGLAKGLRVKSGDVFEIFVERGDLVFRIKERAPV